MPRNNVLIGNHFYAKHAVGTAAGGMHSSRIDVGPPEKDLCPTIRGEDFSL
jgi:hypothetical protein